MEYIAVLEAAVVRHAGSSPVTSTIGVQGKNLGTNWAKDPNQEEILASSGT